MIVVQMEPEALEDWLKNDAQRWSPHHWYFVIWHQPSLWLAEVYRRFCPGLSDYQQVDYTPNLGIVDG